eukprot:TRINITY_DN21547_c0_g1_i1.p1 TRINITY_DN21547_c0_g1~~TRINITY_DN21547_c0_g1_i1.p1  ORF type:complete len:128 (+),score=27.10 TRINITY_DN21547_c0_g1_i1:63-446(+)
MAHSLAPTPPIPSPISTRMKKKGSSPFLGFHRKWSAQLVSDQALDAKSNAPSVHRRVFVWGLMGVVFGSMAYSECASAAKRGPPPPPTEKKDPNISGVQAKVLASIKRKEAMKEAVKELRERGKPVE